MAMGALVLASVSIPSTLAQCGLPTKTVKPTGWSSQLRGAHLIPAAMAAHDDEERDNLSIVGMWHVTFTAKTSNKQAIADTVIDNALAVWHADKTEIMNSVRPPQDGDFCMGVWEQTGRSRYLLNHFAWFANEYPNNTINGIGMPVGPTRFVESVTVSPDGNHFSGTFTLDAYDVTGKIDVQSYTGVITATRITTSTTIGDLV